MARLFNLVPFFVCCLLWVTTVRAQELQAKDGVLDARNWNAENRLPLVGHWKMAENVLVQPDQLSNVSMREVLVPSLWNDARNDGTGLGVATYKLTILLPPNTKDIAIHIPQLYSSFSLFANGQQVTSAGKPGINKETTTPQWIARAVPLVPVNDSIQLVLQLANFHHYKGGIKDTIYIGTTKSLQHYWSWVFGSNAVETTVLFLEALVFFVFYWIRKKRILLFFSMLCLSWMTRSLFSNLYPITVLIPGFDWNWQVRIEYFTLFSTIIWAALFLHDLFDRISNKLIVYTLVGLNVIFFVFTLFATPYVFTRWVSLFLSVGGVLVIYAAVLVVRAILFEYTGAWFLLASLVTGIIMFGYDIIAYQSLHYNFLFLNIGYVIMFLFTTTSLLYHLNILKSHNQVKNVLTYKDFFQ